MGLFTIDKEDRKPDPEYQKKLDQELKNGSYKVDGKKEISFKLNESTITKLKKYAIVKGLNKNSSLDEIIENIFESQDIDKKYKDKTSNLDINKVDIDRIYENSSSYDHHSYSDHTTYTNPGTGLPMSNGIGGVDVGGNPYGSHF